MKDEHRPLLDRCGMSYACFIPSLHGPFEDYWVHLCGPVHTSHASYISGPGRLQSRVFLCSSGSRYRNPLSAVPGSHCSWSGTLFVGQHKKGKKKGKKKKKREEKAILDASRRSGYSTPPWRGKAKPRTVDAVKCAKCRSGALQLFETFHLLHFELWNQFC